MYLLDTNACIDFLHARSDALAEQMRAQFSSLTLSAITVAELLVGSRSSQDLACDARKVETFVASVRVHAFDGKAAATYGRIIRDIGVKRTSFDQLIGTQAVHLGLILVTRDSRHFADVPGLMIENWYK